MRDCMQFDDAICKYAICRYAICARDARDEAISESHKCIDLTPVDGSSVDFFSFIANALFSTLSRLVASWIAVIVTPGLYRLGIGSLLSAGERPMTYLGPLDWLFRHC